MCINNAYSLERQLQMIEICFILLSLLFSSVSGIPTWASVVFMFTVATAYTFLVGTSYPGLRDIRTFSLLLDTVACVLLFVVVQYVTFLDLSNEDSGLNPRTYKALSQPYFFNVACLYD